MLSVRLQEAGLAPRDRQEGSLDNTRNAAFNWGKVAIMLAAIPSVEEQWFKILILAPGHNCLLAEAFRLLEECYWYQVLLLSMGQQGWPMWQSTAYATRALRHSVSTLLASAAALITGIGG